MRRLELRDDAFEIMSGRPDYDHHCTRMVGVDRWRGKEDRIPSDQAVVDETFCEGLCAVRTFELRLLDGMNPTVPEVTVLHSAIIVRRIVRRKTTLPAGQMQCESSHQTEVYVSESNFFEENWQHSY